MSFWVAVELENRSNQNQTFTIPAGSIFMPKNLGKGQCLVASKSISSTIQAGGKQTVYVETECIDPPLPPPAQIPMVTTPFGQKRRRTNPFVV